jgi:hypothetical protein
MQWGDEHYAPEGPRRRFLHAADDAPIDAAGACTTCGRAIAPADIAIEPGPGAPAPHPDDDTVTIALRARRRLLQPLR